MKYLLSVFVALSLTMGPDLANASTSAGQVDTYSTDAAYFYFKTGGTIAGKPVCNSQSRYAVSLATDSGRSIASQIASAKQSGLTVSVTGKNACGLSADSEDVASISVTGTASIGLPAQYWATSDGGSACSAVCSMSGGAAVANSTGAVCKNANGTPYMVEFRGNFFYECGGGNARTAQCSCMRK